MTSSKTQKPGMLFLGAIFLLIVLFYLPKYAPALIENLNQYSFFIMLINFAKSFPYVALFIFSAVITFLSTLLMKYLTDQDHLKALKKRQKELQKDIKQHQKNKEFTKIEELNKEVLEISLSMMKASFNIKQIVITIVPFFLLFLWLKEIFMAMLGWSFFKFFMIYIIFSIVTSTLYRKMLKMA